MTAIDFSFGVKNVLLISARKKKKMNKVNVTR